MSLYAAFNNKTGKVLGKTAARHTSAEFAAFLTDIVIDQPRGKEIHVIADNLSAHKSRPVTEFLAVHPKVHLHFTPTYSSWLNQVELWFGKSSATSSREAYSLPFLIWTKSSCDTSVSTTNRPEP